jgi:hypothetical protein
VPCPRRRPPAALLSLAVALVGCNKYKQADFVNDYAEAVCTLYEQCEVLTVTEDFADKTECLTTVGREVDETAGACAEWDEEQGLSCVNGLNEMSCEELYAGDWPEACADACPDGSAVRGGSEEDEADAG